MGVKTLEVMNAIQAEHKLVMFECRDGKVFWLINHHRYSDHREEGMRVFIGVGKFKERYKYVTERLNEIK